MTDVLTSAIIWLVLYTIVVASGAIRIYRDIAIWKRARARNKLGTAILNSRNL